MTLSVKDAVKSLPVFCRNDIGGHLGVLVDQPWNTQYASHAIRKAFEKANIKNITANALRRFFIQKAQTLADDSKVASIAGHHPNSAVQYTKYGSTFSTLDIVKMIQYSKFEDMKEANKFIEGVRCPQQLFKRMTKQEYEKEVAPFIEQEKKDLEAVVASMKESYGTKYKTSIESWSVLDTKKYKMACRRYKNARDRYRRKGLKKLPEERQKKALKEMKVDENEAVVTDDIEEVSIVMIEEHILEDNGASITTTRTMDDSRIARIQQVATMNATNLVGLHDCQLCKEDDTIKEKRKPIYGHKAHLMHLLQGLIAPGWVGNTSNKRGQHTESVTYCTVEEAKEVIVKYFWENFQVEWDPSELDRMLQERKPQEKKG